jgi:4-aminobutyrate aminotransferase-like enzyme
MDQELRQAAKDLLIRYGGDSFPNLFKSAKGTVVIDDEGREILDFTSGQMCATVGHNHPAIVRAIRESCDTAIHMFSGMIPETVAKLARKLGEWLPPPLKKSLFVNTGSEANEAALRIAKLATGGYEVIALGGSWHGTTGASAAASYASDRRGYGPKAAGRPRDPGAQRLPLPGRALPRQVRHDVPQDWTQDVRHGDRWRARRPDRRAGDLGRRRHRAARRLFRRAQASLRRPRHAAGVR